MYVTSAARLPPMSDFKLKTPRITERRTPTTTAPGVLGDLMANQRLLCLPTLPNPVVGPAVQINMDFNFISGLGGFSDLRSLYPWTQSPPVTESYD